MKQIFTMINVVALLFLVPSSGYAQVYDIKGELKHFEEDTIYLGYYYADKQYLIDTTTVVDGQFRFSGTDTLASGVYLVVMPPNNTFFQLLIDGENANIAFSADHRELSNSIQFRDSPDNTLFYENLRYIAEKRKEGDVLNKDLENALDEGEKTKIQQQLAALSKEVMAYQELIVEKNPQSLTAALIGSGFNAEIPDFEGTEEEVQVKRYLHYKKHYFDNIDLSDDRLLRAPQHVLFDRVQYYLEKLTPQHPDSIIVSLDYLLGQMKPASTTFRYYLMQFLNEYAASKYVGQDAVFVHIAEKYYAAGDAHWLDEKQLAKIVDKARKAKPTLIGKTAPDFTVQRRDGSNVSLSDIEAEYLILIFWAHDCGHCKESMPALAEFYKKYKGTGVEVFSICTKVKENEPPCWDFVDEKGLGDFLNASDQKEGYSFIHSLYNIETTPKLFVLDRDKKIVTKALAVENLPAFFEAQGITALSE